MKTLTSKCIHRLSCGTSLWKAKSNRTDIEKQPYLYENVNNLKC